MSWPSNWFEWLWTVASLVVLVDTPIAIWLYHVRGLERRR